MRTSTEAAAVSDALVKASLLLTNPAKTESAEIPGKEGRRGYSYTYAGLAAILDEVRPVLQAHGLALVQEAAEANAGVGITTRLVHSSGEWIEYGPLVIPCAADARAIGSATTYGRRYQLCAALGIAADDDDDGRIASPAPRASRANSTATADNEAQRASAGDPPASGPEPVPAPDSLGEPEAGATSEGVSASAGYGEGPKGGAPPSDTPFQRVKAATGSAAKARAAINRVCDLEYTARTVINATDEEADITIAALAEGPLPRGSK